MPPSELELQPLLAAIYAISIYLTTVVTAKFLFRLNLVKEAMLDTTNRIGDIDGLRGLLAVSVFIHHSYAGYGYFYSGLWKYSSSPILNQLGQASVAIFFMITGYLFTLKSLTKPIKWRNFYIARIARLFPLYILIVIAVFTIVFIVTNTELREPYWKIVVEFLQWMTFGRPNINSLERTWTIIAGVNWSLRYELLFYVLVFPSLCLLSNHLSVPKLLSTSLIVLSLILIYRGITGSNDGHILRAAQFLGGITLAYAFKIKTIYNMAKTPVFFIISLLIGVQLLWMEYSYSNLGVLSTILLFSLFAKGLPSVAFLRSTPVLWVGEISYGIYLIHGIVIWITLYLIKKYSHIENLNLISFWIIMTISASFITVLASISFIKLEKPFMKMSRQLSRQ